MDSVWTGSFPGAITVCDRQGIILDMNDQSAEAFSSFGGRERIGENLLDCHPEPSRTKLERMLETGERNVYTIEKNGVKKLVYQVPWFQDGERAGLVELILEIPFELPHFVRT
jgi:hypothetical protein